MNHRSPLFRRGAATVAVALMVLGQLLWQHLHGGIVSHHLLHRADLPAISNAWGMLLLPVLAWWLTGRVQQRTAAGVRASTGETGKPFTGIALGFLAALAFGAFFAIAFEQHWPIDLGRVLLAVFALAVLVPLHRAECVLGFVLTMSFAFGAVIATAVAAVIAAWSLALHRCLHPAIARLWRRLDRRGEAEVRGNHPR